MTEGGLLEVLAIEYIYHWTTCDVSGLFGGNYRKIGPAKKIQSNKIK